ncbi:DUF930 domain-containing protein [Aureimonas sp. SK2]|uniref:DUF930 domain-containing protein n=1 Tax=Aureimonas sp. SK2 TaxID=3015992 RepID=UPI00387E8605
MNVERSASLAARIGPGDRAVRAKGAAFRNDGNWFRLRFRCAVTQDRLHVKAVD